MPLLVVRRSSLLLLRYHLVVIGLVSVLPSKTGKDRLVLRDSLLNLKRLDKKQNFDRPEV